MADKAIANISTSIFLDEIKSSMGGELNFEPADSGDKWIFSEASVSSSSTDLIGNIDFLGSTIPHEDKVMPIAIVKVVSI